MKQGTGAISRLYLDTLIDGQQDIQATFWKAFDTQWCAAQFHYTPPLHQVLGAAE
jgi:hypothetical protein